MNNFQKILNRIKFGTKEGVKLAQKELNKVWHRSWQDKKLREDLINISLSELNNFGSIANKSNQIAFISSLKFLFMTSDVRDDAYDACQSFLIKIIQHPLGHLRQTMVYLSDWLIMGFRIWDDDYLGRKLDKKLLEKHLNRFGQLVEEVEALIEDYHRDQYNRYKYISSLPPSVYKTLQMLRSNLLGTEHFEKAYEKYKKVKIKKILPQIRFKYRDLKRDSQRPRYSDLVCILCGKSNVSLGAVLGANSDSYKIICEDCAIIQYQRGYGFVSKEVAAARRRRMFDVGYLFNEMVIDKYLETKELKSMDELDDEEFRYLLEIGNRAYNELLSKSKKIRLEETEKQEDIERGLKKFLERVKFD